MRHAIRRGALPMFVGAPIALGLIHLAGCLGDDPPMVVQPPADSAASETSVDAAPLPACDLDKPFGAIVAVPNVNSTATEEAMRLTADELTAYVATTRSEDGGLQYNHVYEARRGSKAEPFGKPVRMPGVNTDGYESHPSITADARKLFVVTGRPAPLAGINIFLSVRPDVSAAFESLTIVDVINTDHSDTDPFILPSGKAIYFVSDRPESVGIDIYRAELGGDGRFREPQRQVGVSSADGEAGPIVTPDDLTMYFASTRKDINLGDWDVWMAKRSTTSDAWGNPKPVKELNTKYLDVPTWISADGCTLYFTSNREGSLGSRDIFVATKPP